MSDIAKVTAFRIQSRYKFLKDLLRSETGQVLVVGCGSRDEMSILNKKCKGIGIDISEVAVRKSKRRYPQFEYSVGDAQDLPFKDNSIDCLICSEVIEHLENDEKFIEEAHRVLRKNGRLILTTPNWISWYGFARKCGEVLLRRSLTSGNQPIDHWYTYWSLKKKTMKFFQLNSFQGLWFFPPFGKGKYMIPDSISLSIIKIFDPVNIWFRKVIPYIGHNLVFDLTNKK